MKTPVPLLRSMLPPLPALALALAGLGAGAASALSDSAFPYLEQAMTRVASAARLMNLADFTHAPGNSLFGAFMASGDRRTLTTGVRAGRSYLVIAAGDEDVTDLDLAVRSSSGDLLVEDDDTSAVALVRFTAAESGRINLEMCNYRSDASSFCTMVILEQGRDGGDLTLIEFSEALQNALRLANTTGLLGNTRFVSGGFCVFGGRLAQGADSCVYDFVLPPGRYVAVSAGSDRVLDADLTVVAQHRSGAPEGRVVAEDDAVDSTPICMFRAARGTAYAVTQKNYATLGSGGFLFTCLLEQP